MEGVQVYDDGKNLSVRWKLIISASFLKPEPYNMVDPQEPDSTTILKAPGLVGLNSLFSVQTHLIQLYSYCANLWLSRTRTGIPQFYTYIIKFHPRVFKHSKLEST